MAQLDDYIIPRYRSLDAPLLAVVGGSTGAGKSTLVNALVGYPVTRAGAIRPTTRQPILLHHPAGLGAGLQASGYCRAWAGSGALLSVDALCRRSQARCHPATRRPSRPWCWWDTRLFLHGIALLDAPDVDSISDDNRKLAGQLLAAADLWVFVTTANRYADAVPWRLLLDAASRDIMVAVVLDRVPRCRGGGSQRRTCGQCWTGRAWPGRSCSLCRKVPSMPSGCFPRGVREPLRQWLRDLAADAAGRAEIARRTLNGAVRRCQRAVGRHRWRSAAQEPLPRILRR